MAIDRTQPTPQVRKVAEWPGRATALAFTPDGSLLALGAEDGAVTIHTTTGAEVARFVEGERTILEGQAFPRCASLSSRDEWKV